MGRIFRRQRDRLGRFVAAKKAALQKQAERERATQESKQGASIAAKPEKVGWRANHGTVQIYNKGYEFALMTRVGGDWKQVSTFVYCKDFLHDAVWAWLNKKKFGIYGFTYDPDKDLPLDPDYFALAYRDTDMKPNAFHAQKDACQEMINLFEEKLGWEPCTEIFKVEGTDKGPHWLIVGHKNWRHAPPLVGLFTLLVRVGCYHELGSSLEDTLERAKKDEIKVGNSVSYAGNRDCSYIKVGWEGIQVILKHGLDVFHPRIEDNYPKDLDEKCGGMHGHMGPVSFTKAKDLTPGGNEWGARKAMPHWYRDEIWK